MGLKEQLHSLKGLIGERQYPPVQGESGMADNDETLGVFVKNDSACLWVRLMNSTLLKE